MKKLLLFPVFLILASCGTTTDFLSVDNEPAKSSPKSNTSGVAQDYGQAFLEADEMQLFLYEDHSTVTFVGEGNEYAGYTIQTTWLNDQYVRYEQDNGGVVLAKYYRVDKDGIYFIDQVADEETPLTIAELDVLSPISPLLVAPVAIGTSFEGWTITALNASYTTPYDTFERVIVLEKQTKDIVERQYFVAGLGAIGYEFESTDENGETSIISSKLATITY